MKIALIGYGKMGKMIEEVAKTKGHEIVAAIRSGSPLQNPDSRTAVTAADVCIDFSHPDCALSNVKTAAALRLNLITGTTGWHAQLEEAERIAKDAGIGFLYSANFSLGCALFLKIVKEATTLFAPFPQYDAAGIEIHHRQKQDAPSGTAKAMHPLPFASVRVGHVPGTHTVMFDSEADTITLTHAARNRKGFAEGAVAAAEWLKGKSGIFSLSDMLEDQGYKP